MYVSAKPRICGNVTFIQIKFSILSGDNAVLILWGVFFISSLFEKINKHTMSSSLMLSVAWLEISFRTQYVPVAWLTVTNIYTTCQLSKGYCSLDGSGLQVIY